MGSITQFIYPAFRLPQFAYIIVALVGLFWSGFKTYQVLLDQYRSVIDTDKVTLPNPHIKISLVEGNEYSFQIEEPYDNPNASLYIRSLKLTEEKELHYDEAGILYIDGVLYYVVPRVTLTLNLRIENDGNIPIDILNINGSFIISQLKPFSIYLDTSLIKINNKSIEYPLHLKPTTVMLMSMGYRIQPEETKAITNAQVAVAVRELGAHFLFTLKLDTLDGQGKHREFPQKFDISFRPLVDVFISQWQAYNQVDLLRLSGKVND